MTNQHLKHTFHRFFSVLTTKKKKKKEVKKRVRLRRKRRRSIFFQLFDYIISFEWNVMKDNQWYFHISFYLYSYCEKKNQHTHTLTRYNKSKNTVLAWYSEIRPNSVVDFCISIITTASATMTNPKINTLVWKPADLFAGLFQICMEVRTIRSLTWKMCTIGCSGVSWFYDLKDFDTVILLSLFYLISACTWPEHRIIKKRRSTLFNRSFRPHDRYRSVLRCINI